MRLKLRRFFAWLRALDLKTNTSFSLHLSVVFCWDHLCKTQFPPELLPSPSLLSQIHYLHILFACVFVSSFFLRNLHPDTREQHLKLLILTRYYHHHHHRHQYRHLNPVSLQYMCVRVTTLLLLHGASSSSNDGVFSHYVSRISPETLNFLFGFNFLLLSVFKHVNELV